MNTATTASNAAHARPEATDPSGEFLRRFLQSQRAITREHLINDGLLKRDSPPKGTRMLTDGDRSSAGNDALREAKAVLTRVIVPLPKCDVQRTHRELLTITVAEHKEMAFDFLPCSTRIPAVGTWRDPNGLWSDHLALNTVIEVEYGETADELVGDAILVALRLINNLEVNEQVLYVRMMDIEQSSLVD